MKEKCRKYEIGMKKKCRKKGKEKKVDKENCLLKINKLSRKELRRKKRKDYRLKEKLKFKDRNNKNNI
jgi:hypothetical protein